MHALDYAKNEQDFKIGDFDQTMNNSNNNIIMGEQKDKVKNIFHLGWLSEQCTFSIQDSSDTVEVEKKRRSSRTVSKPVKFADFESLDYSDEDLEPSIKRSKTESSKMKNKVSCYFTYCKL